MKRLSIGEKKVYANGVYAVKVSETQIEIRHNDSVLATAEPMNYDNRWESQGYSCGDVVNYIFNTFAMINIGVIVDKVNGYERLQYQKNERFTDVMNDIDNYFFNMYKEGYMPRHSAYGLNGVHVSNRTSSDIEFFEGNSYFNNEIDKRFN